MDPIPLDQSSQIEPQIPVGVKHEKNITLNSGEVIILKSENVGAMRLFHGSPIPGITEFRDAEETTIGNGFYATSSREAAASYSVVRSNTPENRFLYEVEISDLNIVDLSSHNDLDNFAKLLREKLALLQGTLKANNEAIKWYAEEQLRQTIEMIDQKKYKYLKEICQPYGDLTRKTLIDLGYDGLVAFEGGEAGNGANIGRHDSYVIFDPKKVKVITEEPTEANISA